MPRHFTPGISLQDEPAEPCLWFLFRGYRLLVRQDGERTHVPIMNSVEEFGLPPVQSLYLGTLTETGRTLHCYCGEVSEDIPPPAGMAFEGLRPLYAQMDEDEFWLAGRAVQIVDWDRTHRFCGRCGAPTVNQSTERAKSCPACGLTNYPRLAPAIIVRVQRWDDTVPKILLARASRFPTSMFSVLAGFVEPGETLEECVQREIQEEVGITVTNIAYFGSQPWPFPHSLMIAFTADHVSGELQIDPNEIAEAGWFPANALPNTPPPPSIANRLIASWLLEVSGISSERS